MQKKFFDIPITLSRRRNPLPSVCLAALASMSAPLLAAGFLTSEDPFITLDPGVLAGSTVLVIIGSGATLGEFTFQGLPDGIGALRLVSNCWRNLSNRLDRTKAARSTV